MDLELDGYIACMYEGEAERAILDILLDNDKFKFSREEILEEEPIPRCKPKDFERNYLRKSFKEKSLELRMLQTFFFLSSGLRASISLQPSLGSLYQVPSARSSARHSV